MARQPGNFPVLQPLAVHSSLLSDLSLNPSLSFFCFFFFLFWKKKKNKYAIHTCIQTMYIFVDCVLF